LEAKYWVIASRSSRRKSKPKPVRLGRSGARSKRGLGPVFQIPMIAESTP
jgi:hypothetical protein